LHMFLPPGGPVWGRRAGPSRCIDRRRQPPGHAVCSHPRRKNPQIAFAKLLRRLPRLRLETNALEWEPSLSFPNWQCGVRCTDLIFRLSGSLVA
jgi:hypothetical protein